MKRGTTEIFGVERGQTPIRTIFRNGYKVFGSESHKQEPCFEVVNAISGATGDYVDVYNTTDEKWYKLNNLNEYEEYGIMPTVDALSGVTYYVGKLVILSTDNHEYKWNGSSWTDLGECESSLPSGYVEYESINNGGKAWFDSGYYCTQNTKLSTKAQVIGMSSPQKNPRICGAGFWNAIGGIHICYEPISSPKLYMKWGGNTTWYNTGVSYDLNVHTYELSAGGGYLDGTKVYNISSAGNFTSEYTLNIMNTNNSGYGEVFDGRMFYFKIYESDVLVRNFVPSLRKSDNKAGFFDTINNVFYGSSNSDSFSVDGSPVRIAPEDYDTKVAPANHVEYQTLEQLEAMECPWYGMEAKVSGILYLYTENGWEQQQTPCFEVVDALSAATGNYVDVYNNTNKKWYKKNNLSQYEEYGILPEVDSLSELTYYTGKLAVNTTDNHEYKYNGTDWVDIGEVVTSGTSEYFLAASTSSESAYYHPGYYFGDGYHVELDVSFTTYNTLPLLNCSSPATSPIEFVSYSNGFYNDFHAPLSTTDNSCYTGDYSQRNIITSMGISPLVNRRFRIRVGICDVKWYDYETGTELYSSSPIYSGYNWYNGLYFGEIGCSSDYTLRYKGFKVYDANENLVNDIEARYRPGTTADKQIYFHDNVLNVDYENVTENPVGYYEQGNQVTVYPEDYNTKVAPANYVNYNTLEELEMMECPWYGMRAYVNGVLYEYGDWGWQLPNRFITFTSDGEWTDSAYSFTDYLTQQSNNEKTMNGYKCVKVEWLGYPEFFINVDSYAYSNTSQYLCAMDMDGDKPSSIPSYNTTGVKYSTYNRSLDGNTLSNYNPVLYQNDGESHHAWIVYRQNNTSQLSTYTNKGYIAVLDYTTTDNVEYRVSQTEYLGSNGTYYEKVYQWYQKGGTWSQSNSYKEGEQLQTVNRVSQNEYLGSNGTYYQKVYVDVVTPDGTQRSTGYYVQGSQLSTTYIDSQTEYMGNDPYYAKSWCYVTTPDNLQRITSYYTAGQQLNTIETWQGETILWDDSKRYKYNNVVVELLNGTTVQPNALATKKGDYIEDVTPVVPSGYVQLDWIETTSSGGSSYNTKYIDLGTSISATNEIYMKCIIPQTTDISDNHYHSFFGSEEFQICETLSSGFNYCCAIRFNDEVIVDNTQPRYRYPSKVLHEVKMNNTGFYYKDYSGSTWSDFSSESAAQGHTLPTGTDKTQANNALFISYSHLNNSSWYNAIARVYKLIITDKDTGTVLHNFVPCFKADVNRLGLYDTVTSTFKETYAFNDTTLNNGFNCGVTCIEGTTTNTNSSYECAFQFRFHVVDNGQSVRQMYCNYNDMYQLSNNTISYFRSLFYRNNGGGAKTITKFNMKDTHTTDMRDFCYLNKELTSVDFSGINTSTITNMPNTFAGTNITYINANGWDTSNVTNMAETFLGSNSLVECDIRSWSTESLTSYDYMFYNCTSLNKLYIGSGFFNSPTITNYSMFSPLSAWTDQTSLAMFVDAITAHDGTGKTVTLHANTKTALSSAQIAAIEAANWTIA